jgi:hypothetical protein
MKGFRQRLFSTSDKKSTLIVVDIKWEIDATDLAIFGQASAIRMIVQFSYLIFRITEEEIPRRR